MAFIKGTYSTSIKAKLFNADPKMFDKAVTKATDKEATPGRPVLGVRPSQLCSLQRRAPVHERRIRGSPDALDVTHETSSPYNPTTKGLAEEGGEESEAPDD